MSKCDPPRRAKNLHQSRKIDIKLLVYIISFATYGHQRIAQIVIVGSTQISIFHLHRRTSNPARRLLLTRPALTASIGAELESLQVFALRESNRRTSHSRHCGSSLKRTEQESPPIAQRAFSQET